jgi:hypothetical protein
VTGSTRAESAGATRTPDGAARDRVAATLARLDRIDVEVVVVAGPDQDRQAAMDRARAAALAGGRGKLLDEASGAARDLAIRAFSRRGFSGTWAAADWSISTSGPRDRAAVATAFEEAATAAVVEGLVDGETLGVLRATSERLTAMTGVPHPGSLSNIGLGAFRSAATGTAVVVAAVALGVTAGSATGGIVGFGVAIAILAGLRRLRSPSSSR